jgi:hypothetical protein
VPYIMLHPVTGSLLADDGVVGVDGGMSGIDVCVTINR